MSKLQLKKGQSLGLDPKLKEKSFPYATKFNGEVDFSLVMSESDKEEGDFLKIKSLVNHYEWVGRRQIQQRYDKIQKNFNIVNGVINKDDYVKSTSEVSMEINMLDGQDLNFELQFYPIVMPVVNTLVNERSKHKVVYQCMAVNPEATNQIIEEKNEEIRQLLLSPLQQQFEQDLVNQGIDSENQPDVYQQQMQLFQSLPKVQEYYSKHYRLGVEKWASNQMFIDEKRFKIKEVEKELLKNKLTCDMPFIHINLLDEDYKPEVLDPRYCFWLRSPNVKDVSEGVMFGWFEYDTPVSLIKRFGSQMSEEDVQKLEDLNIQYTSLFTPVSKARFNMDTNGIKESAQNVIAFQDYTKQVKEERYRGDEYKERLIEVCNMYMQVPRKLGKLTVKQGDLVYSVIVDDSYTVTYKPVYDKTYSKENNEENLISGEHIEWFYVNELWRCIRINLASITNPVNDATAEKIYINLEKFPIQIPEMGKKYGSIIPVFGGPVTNKYNPINSLVSKCASWQILYNYLWNRIDQLIKGEIGKFFAMNQNLIPSESMGESWGPHNFLKWAVTARDTQIGPLDNTNAAIAGTTLAATGGYGQVVDLTVTQEVLEKAQLAERCKNECLMMLGIPPQLLGDISPEMTATGITQGIQRSIIQLKDIYDEHFSLMCSAKTAMLEFAKYLTVKKQISTQTFISEEGERIIFQVPQDLHLHALGIFVSSDMDDAIALENLKIISMQDNTMGSDLLDKITMSSAKSVGELYEKLKNAQIQREAKEKRLMEENTKQQQALLEKEEQMLERELLANAEEKQKDRELELRIQEMKVIGQANFSEGGGLDELIKLRDLQEKESNYYKSLIDREDKNNQYLDSKNREDSKHIDKMKLEREKMQLEREKLLAKLKESKDKVTIAKVNK